MKTVFIVVGKTTDSHINKLVDEYIKRVKHYLPFDVETIPELKNTKNLSKEQQKTKEGELLLKSFKPGDTIVLLDEKGKEFRSVDFANYLQNKLTTINRRLVFVIGGPYGFTESVYEVASEKISLSKMTFSHQMIRILFIEQFYRAMTIIHNEPYHHE